MSRRRAALVPFAVAEEFHPDERRGYHGRWVMGGGHHARLLPRESAPQNTHRGMKADAQVRYEGGVARMSSATRGMLAKVFTAGERIQRPHTQPHADVNKLYEVAQPHQGLFEGILDRGKGISKRLGGRVQSTTTPAAFEKAKADVQNHPDKPHVIIAALKGKDRATDKVKNKYLGDARKLTDIVRGTVLVPHVDDLPAALFAIRKELPKGWTIVSPTNRFVHEHRDHVNTGHLNGYRDISFLIRSPTGFHAELQVNTTHMWIAKEAGVGHALYEDRRRIVEAAHAEGRSLTAAELHKVTKRRRRFMTGRCCRARVSDPRRCGDKIGIERRWRDGRDTVLSHGRSGARQGPRERSGGAGGLQRAC